MFLVGSSRMWGISLLRHGFWHCQRFCAHCVSLPRLPQLQWRTSPRGQIICTICWLAGGRSRASINCGRAWGADIVLRWGVSRCFKTIPCLLQLPVLLLQQLPPCILGLLWKVSRWQRNWCGEDGGFFPMQSQRALLCWWRVWGTWASPVGTCSLTTATIWWCRGWPWSSWWSVCISVGCLAVTSPDCAWRATSWMYWGTVPTLFIYCRTHFCSTTSRFCSMMMTTAIILARQIESISVTSRWAIASRGCCLWYLLGGQFKSSIKTILSPTHFPRLYPGGHLVLILLHTQLLILIELSVHMLSLVLLTYHCEAIPYMNILPIQRLLTHTREQSMEAPNLILVVIKRWCLHTVNCKRAAFGRGKINLMHHSYPIVGMNSFYAHHPSSICRCISSEMN